MAIFRTNRDEQKDLRRIVRGEEDQGALNAAIVKPPIGINGSTGWADGNGNSGAVAGGTEPLPTEDITSDGLSGQQNNGEIIDPNANSDSVNNILDGNIQNGEALKQIESKDCDAPGFTKIIRTDGEVVPPIETFWPSGLQRTAAWNDAQTPPSQLNFTLGFEWVNAETQVASTPGASAQLHADFANATQSNGVTGWEILDLIFISESSYNYILDSDDSPIPPLLNGVGRIVCTPGSSASCPLVAFREVAWPTFDLSKYYETLNDDGNFVTSEFDPNSPTNTTRPRGQIDFCNDANDRKGRIEATSNGGFMISERDHTTGALIGDYQVFDINSIKIDNVTESVATLLRPQASN